jgi:hypothetical protein
MARRDLDLGTGVLHPLPALGIGADHQQAVAVEQGLAGGVESQEGGSVGVHGWEGKADQAGCNVHAHMKAICHERGAARPGARRSATDSRT